MDEVNITASTEPQTGVMGLPQTVLVSGFRNTHPGPTSAVIFSGLTSAKYNELTLDLHLQEQNWAH